MVRLVLEGLHHDFATLYASEALLSDEHFSVDGTLIEAWASAKSFQLKDGSGGDGSDFRQQQRSNESHASVTDPDCRLYKKSPSGVARLCYMGHALMENRHGLAVGGMVTTANGTAKREAAEALLAAKVKDTGKPATVGADKAYDALEHGANLRKLGVDPHVARSDYPASTGKQRRSVVSDETAASAAYGMSQTHRKLIECIFGWGKQHGTLRKTKHRGIARVSCDFLLNIIAYNLIRIPKLLLT